jgi:hypothetical protein
MCRQRLNCNIDATPLKKIESAKGWGRESLKSLSTWKFFQRAQSNSPAGICPGRSHKVGTTYFLDNSQLHKLLGYQGIRRTCVLNIPRTVLFVFLPELCIYSATVHCVVSTLSCLKTPWPLLKLILREEIMCSSH